MVFRFSCYIYINMFLLFVAMFPCHGGEATRSNTTGEDYPMFQNFISLWHFKKVGMVLKRGTNKLNVFKFSTWPTCEKPPDSVYTLQVCIANHNCRNWYTFGTAYVQVCIANHNCRNWYTFGTAYVRFSSCHPAFAGASSGLAASSGSSGPHFNFVSPLTASSASWDTLRYSKVLTHGTSFVDDLHKIEDGWCMYLPANWTLYN